MSHWRLLLTRPEGESRALACELASHGHYGSCLPMLVIEPLPPPVRPPGWLQGFAAVVVVSKPAAHLCLRGLEHQLATPGPRWFAVGAATAAVLEQHGLAVSFPRNGDDSEALWQLPSLAAVLAGPKPRVLIVRGQGGREWLGERLAERGAEVEYLELYRRGVPDYPASAVAERLQAERLNGAVVSSGQGLEHLHRLAGAAWPALAALPLFVPSARVAGLAQALGCRHPVNCRGASSAALIAALATQGP
ncbi:uroporphyrinogen-III synthase [Pseudomonas sp. RIT-PI-S]|uniref:uroporphyrinogen-III synthase n=1 Tax=Pseudomonas sp. RIT-PI-S TaxID=3035295 RepID=UPI0021DB6DA1|nr:uroporphyrinogen-III synthase [Pseudomonas sp. RIT-PI-S]